MIVDTDDLEIKCYACGGTGVMREPEKEGTAGVDAGAEKQAGYIYRLPWGGQTCPKCEGRGTLLTAAGKQLVGILRKYL